MIQNVDISVTTQTSSQLVSLEPKAKLCPLLSRFVSYNLLVADYRRVLAKPFPKGTVTFGGSNMFFGSHLKTNNVSFGSTPKPTYF